MLAAGLTALSEPLHFWPTLCLKVMPAAQFQLPRFPTQRVPPDPECSRLAGISKVLLRTVQPSIVPPPLAVLAT